MEWGKERRWKQRMKKGAAVVSGCLAVFLMAGRAEVSAAPIPLRGVVEGFYGTPWSQEDREDMIRFCGGQGLNAYIYAPKDDPYHRARWREPYPEEKLSKLASLSKLAKTQGVRFIFAISPGLDIRFSGYQGFMDRLAMQKKIEAMYRVGVRDFAIFFDDIPEKNGKGQADFLNWIEANVLRKYPDVNPLITVPTEYFRADMVREGTLTDYSRDFSSRLNRDVLVLYTGDAVVGDGLSDAQYREMIRIYGRSLGVWWNYPVSDYKESKLALGPVEKLPTMSSLPAIFFNPMKYETLSRIALATGAAYAKDPEQYIPQRAWEAALSEQYGPLAEAMQQFAGQSQRMENDWAHVGRPDGPVLRRMMDSYWKEIDCREGEASQESLRAELLGLRHASSRLLDGLPAATRKECEPQLKQLIRIVDADLAGLDVLAAKGQGRDTASLLRIFRTRCEEVRRYDGTALIAEKSARRFMDELFERTGGM
ncbi:protein O-GlcNAcase [Selenomonas montiformis]